MLSGLLRELNYLLKHKWDLCLVTLAPLFIIVLFSSMFAQGKPEHLPIAIIDQDQSELSQNIKAAQENLRIQELSFKEDMGKRCCN
jgi:ABC-2 type transport system permease protein